MRMSELKEPDYSSFGDYVAIARFTYDGSGKLVRRDNLENGFYLEYIWDGANMDSRKPYLPKYSKAWRYFAYSSIQTSVIGASFIYKRAPQ